MTPEDSSPYSATAGLPFDDEELESKLVWIYGSPRSGSTWLLEMLCHPLQLRPTGRLGFEWREGWTGPAPALPVNEFQISGHFGAGIFGSPGGSDTVRDDDGTVLPRTLNRATEEYSSYALSTAFGDVWRPEARRLALVRLYAVIQRAREAGLDVGGQLPLLVIKEVNASHAADLMMSLFPRSRMIFLVRDGRDVVDSILDATGSEGWLTKWRGDDGGVDSDAARLDLVRESARQWTARMNVCRRAFEAHDHALRRQVRYEDLLADAARSMTEIARWLDLPGGRVRMQNVAKHHSFEAVPQSRTGPGRFRRSATPGSWREGLTPEEQEVAGAIMTSTLAELGYESSPEPA